MGRYQEAAEWGVKAAARPNAHAHVRAIGAYALALAGQVDQGRAHLIAVHRTLPSYSVDDFLTAMQFVPADEALFRAAARALGTK